MSKYEFNDLIDGSISTTSNPILTQTHSYLNGIQVNHTGINNHTSINTNYLISIPDGEITFEELNKTMNTLSNAVVHMQTKIKDLEKKKESEKINKRNIFKK